MILNVQSLRWSLEELASIDEQKRLWLGASQDEISSFEEACCSVFDDSGLTRSLDKGEILEAYGSDVVEEFQLLSALIDKVPSNLSPSKLIELPALSEIRGRAEQLLKSKVFS